MNHIDFIYEFFSHVKCANCQEFFKNDSIQLIRQETNNTVVRIVCSNCGKNLGLAILGVDSAKYKNSLELEENTCQTEDIPVVLHSEPVPITYDDVIKAHEFFSRLGDDWAKHLPKTE